MGGVQKKVAIIHSRTQLLAGIFLLLLGSLVYIIDRSPDQVYFTRYFGIHLNLFDADTRLLGPLGMRLPGFFHVLSFSLITGAFFRSGKKRYLLICAGWLLVNCCFELGQKYKAVALKLTPAFFEKIPFLENTRAYFTNGTFDVYDLAAFGMGALAAYGLLLITGKDKRKISNIQ
ncbi:MAG: hypothetical protein JRF32_11060 [Deltaproteobacteria bacterium]|nr:hypothetical protein [Deltaproteobacteria bacterium]